jgi:hypothetical protein
VTAAFALIAFLGFHRWQEGDERPAQPALLVVGGDSCRLVPTSCLGTSAPTSVLLAPEGSLEMEQPLLFGAIETVDGDAPLEAFVLVPAPPPRFA